MAQAATANDALLFDGRYILEHELPRWGVGICHRATDRKEQRPVVLKTLRPPRANMDRERFKVLVDHLQRHKLAGTAEVLGHGWFEDAPYVTFAPASGVSLGAWIERHRSERRWPDPAEVWAIFGDVCNVVARAHKVKKPGPMPHGFITQESVLVECNTRIPEVVVLDLGLETFLRGTVFPREWEVADPRAPEIVEHPGTSSVAGDVFALCVLLVSMLAPWQGARSSLSWAGLASASEGKVPGTLRSLRGDLDKAIWSEIAVGLKAQPDARHANAEKLRTILQRLDWKSKGDPGPIPAAPRPSREPMDKEREPPLQALPSALAANMSAILARPRNSPEPRKSPIPPQSAPSTEQTTDRADQTLPESPSNSTLGDEPDPGVTLTDAEEPKHESPPQPSPAPPPRDRTLPLGFGSLGASRSVPPGEETLFASRPKVSEPPPEATPIVEARATTSPPAPPPPPRVESDSEIAATNPPPKSSSLNPPTLPAGAAKRAPRGPAGPGEATVMQKRPPAVAMERDPNLAATLPIPMHVEEGRPRPFGLGASVPQPSGEVIGSAPPPSEPTAAPPVGRSGVNAVPRWVLVAIAAFVGMVGFWLIVRRS